MDILGIPDQTEDIVETGYEDENQPFGEVRLQGDDDDDNGGSDDDGDDGGDNNPDEEALEMPPSGRGGEDNNAAAVKPKRIVKNPKPKLDVQRLMGPRGVPSIQRVFRDAKWMGKGHEDKDIRELLRRLQHWGHRLFPALPFSDLLAHVEKLGKKKNVKVHIKKLRMDMFVEAEVAGENKDDEVRRWGDDQDNEPEPVVDVFDELLGTANNPPTTTTTITTTTALPVASQVSVTLTEEQKERVERNRRLASERRLARQQQQEDQAREDALKEVQERQKEEEEQQLWPDNDAFDALISREEQSEGREEEDPQNWNESTEGRKEENTEGRNEENPQNRTENNGNMEVMNSEELVITYSGKTGRKCTIEDMDLVYGEMIKKIRSGGVGRTDDGDGHINKSSRNENVGRLMIVDDDYNDDVEYGQKFQSNAKSTNTISKTNARKKDDMDVIMEEKEVRQEKEKDSGVSQRNEDGREEGMEEVCTEDLLKMLED